MAQTTHADPTADQPSTADFYEHLKHRMTLPGYDVEIGPFGHLAAERERLGSLEWNAFDVEQLSATIGGVVSGIDLTVPVPDDVIAELRQALLDFKVLFFRDQSLTPDQHLAFARRFGDLEVHPFLPPNAEHPELVRFEKGGDVGGYENGWHSDVTWRARPSMGAVLHVIEVPAAGGDTLFADMAAAYLALDPETRDRVDDLVAVHDYSLAFGHGQAPEELARMREHYPPVEHPVVRTHPETGARLLYVNRYFTREIVGLDPDESHALIDRLSRTAETVEFQCRFRWQPHSVAFWDNRAVQHYASSDYFPARRVAERASIVGDRPY